MVDKKPGRPTTAPEDKEKPLEFSVQPELWEYLQLLADTHFVGPSPDQVARHILIEAAELRRREKYLGVDYTPPIRPKRMG